MGFPARWSVTVRILGIDPGSLITGYGVIEGRANRLLYVGSGAIRTKARTSFPDRLKVIYDGLEQVLAQYQPDGVGVENIFHAHNIQSALKLGHARGVALLAVVNAGLPLAEYLPMEVKKSVVGSGHADKEQVRRTIEMLLNARMVKGYDASDALAVAICHYYSAQTAAKLQRMEGRR